MNRSNRSNAIGYDSLRFGVSGNTTLALELHNSSAVPLTEHDHGVRVAKFEILAR